MGRLVDIKWAELNISVVAELADEQNPEICQEFWEGLPFKVLQAHPVVSGESLYAWVPIISTAPVRTPIRLSDCKVGDLRFSQKSGNKFSINYGKSTETLAQPILGRVLPEYHHLLPKVGEAIWSNLTFADFNNKAVIFVEVSPHDAAQAFSGKGRFADLKGVAKEFYDEAKRVETVEPQDLKSIRRGEIGETGCFGQYFSALDFVHGMLRDHITYTAFNWIKYVDILSHEALVAVIEMEDDMYSEYLGFSGLVTLREFSLKLRKAIRETEDKEELKALLGAFVMYGSRLCAWAYYYFPWHLGQQFGRRVNGQAGPGKFQLSVPAQPSAETVVSIESTV